MKSAKNGIISLEKPSPEAKRNNLRVRFSIPKGIDFIKEISSDLDQMSTGIESLVACRPLLSETQRPHKRSLESIKRASEIP